MMGKSPSLVNNWLWLCITSTCLLILLLTHNRMFKVTPAQGFCVGWCPPLSTRDTFMDASLPVSPTQTSHRGSLSVTRNNEIGVGGPLTSPARKRAVLNKMLCHRFFFFPVGARVLDDNTDSVYGCKQRSSVINVGMRRTGENTAKILSSPKYFYESIGGASLVQHRCQEKNNTKEEVSLGKER